MKLIQFEPIFIRYFSTGDWPFPLHNHNHYELMFIDKGKGVHELNGNRTIYKDKAVFFLSPEDKHHFYIEEETRFSVIKFLPNVLKSGINTNNTDYWNHFLDSLIRKRQENLKIWDELLPMDKIEPLVKLMISEWQENNQKTTELHIHLLRSVLLIIRNSTGNMDDTGDPGITMIEQIQNYIHSNIYFPEKISVKHLSEVFRMSDSKFRSFFTKNMGVSLTEYKTSLKTELIKERIATSDMSLKEISLEFGFNDPSHFSKFLKKQTDKKSGGI